MLTKFLWKGNINEKGGAKFSWHTIYLPGQERGLGIQNSLEWNRAQIITQLLKVVSKVTTLWESWVNSTVLRRKHFWTLNIHTDC